MVVLSDFLSCNIFKALYLKINVGMGKNHHIINRNYPHHFSSSILCHIVFRSFYTVLRLCTLLHCVLSCALCRCIRFCVPTCCILLCTAGFWIPPCALHSCIRFPAPGRFVLLLPYRALLYRLRRYGIMPFSVLCSDTLPAEVLSYRVLSYRVSRFRTLPLGSLSRRALCFIFLLRILLF